MIVMVARRGQPNLTARYEESVLLSAAQDGHAPAG
jgi:hypothetical protein